MFRSSRTTVRDARGPAGASAERAAGADQSPAGTSATGPGTSSAATASPAATAATTADPAATSATTTADPVATSATTANPAATSATTANPAATSAGSDLVTEAGLRRQSGALPGRRARTRYWAIF